MPSSPSSSIPFHQTYPFLAAASPSAHHPLFFFNACDLGQAHEVSGGLDGWAPAVLETGAVGYIGGLWPLDDESASAFSRRFYEAVAEALTKGPVRVGDALASVRRRFFRTGDPTWLAYVYYGDVNLELTAAP